MSERRSNRARKSVDYSKFGDGDDIDDDFRDSNSPPSKKQKVSSKEKNEKKKDLTPIANDKKKRVNNRAALKDDNIYEMELQAALEMSISESQSSQEAPTLEIEPRIPEVEPHVVCISDENEPPPNLYKVEEPIKVVSRKSNPIVDEIEVLGTVYVEEAPAKSMKRTATSKAKKIKSDDDDSDFDAEDENLDEKSDDFDDEDLSEDDDDDSDFGDSRKNSKSKAKLKEKKTTTPSRTKVSASNKNGPPKRVSNQKKTVRDPLSGNKELCRTPGLSSTCKSPLTGVHIKSPNSSIRLGLSRNQRIKPLHPNLKIQH